MTFLDSLKALRDQYLSRTPDTGWTVALPTWSKPEIVRALANRQGCAEHMITDKVILQEYRYVAERNGIRPPTAIEWVGDWHAQ